MTSNNLAISQEMTAAQINRIVLGDSGSDAEFNSLRINYDDMDEDNKHEWPRGHFRIFDGEKTLFAPEVELRIMYKRFQYSTVDDDTHKIKDRSIMFDNFFADIPDTMGTRRCGKLFKKEQEGLSEKELAKQADINCTNVIFGIVSGTGVDEKGEPYTVTNLPCVFYAKGTNFMPMGDAIDSLKRDNVPLPAMGIKLTTERHRNDGVTYWSVLTDRGETYPLDVSASDAVIRFAEYVSEQNDEVLEKHDRVRRKKDSAIRAKASADVIDAVDSSDLDDELPEVMA